MREFTRNPDPPAELAANFEALTVEWLGRVESASPGKAATWTWGPQKDGLTVRDHLMPELIRQTDKHCSYCDGYPVKALSKETVDHFRPKGKCLWPEQA